MRLINVDTFKQQDRFEHNKIPPYAILSHRWGDDEVLYQAYINTSQTDLHDRLSSPGTGRDAGFSKIAGACVQTKKANLKWLWIDTCCIDKPNSTELSRSINSMFKWYEAAQVCFVYLADVDSRKPGVANAIQNSAWFTRGWTLQEMLASRSLQFFEANWQPLGSGRDLAPLLSKGARISEKHLVDFRTASIAQKMSWMASRVTTEEEDTAYCMLGIFDLNMELLYGEGKKAFTRLEELIVTKSSDESIFAWRSPKFESAGLLAPWPDCFRDSGDVVLRPDKISYARADFQMTGQGLRFPAPMYLVYDVEQKTIAHALGAKKKVVEMAMQCWTGDEREPRAIVLYLNKVGGYWKRVRCDEWGLAKKVKMSPTIQPGSAPPYDIYIPQRQVLKG